MPDSIRLSFWLAVYQVLIDDDDDIRDIGAAVASMSLSEVSSSSFNVVPAVACEVLRKYLLRAHNDSEIVAVNSLERLTGQQVGSAMTPPACLITEASEEQNELFYKERQNLYIDEVSEAEAWSRMLRRMPPLSLPEKAKGCLRMFVEEGLEVLKSKANESMDGALGWTSKEEVFKLGMRIIYASSVVLAWEKEAEWKHMDVRSSLEDLLAVGERNMLHPLWLQTISRILDGSEEA